MDSGSGVGMMGESGVQGTHKGHPYRGGEGERRTEAGVGATHPRLPLVQYWGEARGGVKNRGYTCANICL